MSNTKYVTGVTVYNINCDDDIIYVDTSASPVSIVLPNIQNSGITLLTNKTFTINDYTNNASVNNIAIVASGNSVNSGQTTAINSNNGTAFATIVGVNSWQVTTDNPITNGLTYMGTWNATTNDPTLVSSVGIGGQYYIVSVAGTTNLNGTTDWNVGDWAIFIDGTTNIWQKVDNHDIQSYNFIQDEGSALPQQSVIDFQGAGVTASNGTGKTIVTIPIQPAYATIQDESIALPQRQIIDFQGLGVQATDVGGKTVVNVLSGLPAAAYGLYAQTVSSTPITATIAESSLIGSGVGTLTVPANGFFVGGSFNAKLNGHISCVGSATIQIKIKANSVVLGDTGIIALDTTTNKHWQLDLNFTIRNIGGVGVGSIVSSGFFGYIKNSGTNFEGANFITINNTTFDTTISNTLVVTAQWNTTNAGNSIYSDIFVLNKIY
jgi:hypothetical protein